MRPLQGRPAGFTLLELLVVMAIVALLASIALVGYRQARIRGLEASAIGTLNSLNRGQFLYMQTCGGHGYAPSLVSLAIPAPGNEQGFVSADLAVSDPLEKSGYVFQLTGTPVTEGEQTCTGSVPLERYRLTADPMSPGVTGNHFYGTNADRVIYSDIHTFQEDMPESGAPGHGVEIK